MTRTTTAVLLAGCLASALVPSLRAQQAAPSAAAPASYAVGVGDVLAMEVAGSPELNAPAMRVDSDGTVHIPFCDQSVAVAGLRHDAIRTALQLALEKCELAVKPSIEVQVVDVESKPIAITGSVKEQTVIQAMQPIRLLDALTKAGGVSEYAGDEIMVIRHNPDGSEQETSYPASKVLSSVGPQFNPLLSGGEEVRVVQGGRAYVAGDFTTPLAIPMSDSDPVTLQKAIALAHNFGPAAEPEHARLIHNLGLPNSTSENLDLTQILSGKAPDRLLMANDMLFVPVSGTKKFANGLASRTASVLTAAASILIAQ